MRTCVRVCARGCEVAASAVVLGRKGCFAVALWLATSGCSGDSGPAFHHTVAPDAGVVSGGATSAGGTSSPGGASNAGGASKAGGTSSTGGVPSSSGGDASAADAASSGGASSMGGAATTDAGPPDAAAGAGSLELRGAFGATVGPRTAGPLTLQRASFTGTTSCSASLCVSGGLFR